MKIILPYIDFDLNSIVALAKKSPYAYRNKKKKIQDSILWRLKGINGKVLGTNFYRFTWYLPNRRKDPDNIAAGQKIIFDAFQEAGIIENDSRKHVSGFSHSFELDRKNPRVEIEIFEKITT